MATTGSVGCTSISQRRLSGTSMFDLLSSIIHLTKYAHRNKISYFRPRLELAMVIVLFIKLYYSVMMTFIPIFMINKFHDIFQRRSRNLVMVKSTKIRLWNVTCLVYFITCGFFERILSFNCFWIRVGTRYHQIEFYFFCFFLVT